MIEGTTEAALTADEIDRLAEIAIARGVTASQLIGEYIAEGARRESARHESPSAAQTVH